MNEPAQELAYPVYLTLEALDSADISALSWSNAIRYRSFSAAHVEIERQAVEDDREFCVHKRRRTEVAVVSSLSTGGSAFRETNRDVVQAIPKCLVAPEDVARASFEQFTWVTRATRGPTEISERFAADYKVGVQPSVATCNAVVRSLLRLGNVQAVLDFLDELVLCYPRRGSRPSVVDKVTPQETSAQSEPSRTARSEVGAYPSTFRLIVSELMALGWYTRSAHVALAASMCYPETLAEPPAISTNVWMQILDALEDAADVSNAELSLADEGLGTAARIQVASRVFSLLAASPRHAAVFTTRRILRHVECLLSVGNVTAAQAFSLTQIINSANFSVPQVPQQLVSHVLSQTISESLGSLSFSDSLQRAAGDENDEPGKEGNVAPSTASFVLELLNFCFAKDVVIRPDAYCEVLERHAELGFDPSVVLAIVVQQTRHLNHIAASLPLVVGDEAKRLLNGWCRVVSAACRALQHVSRGILWRCNAHCFPGANVASFFAAVWRNSWEEWIRATDHRPLCDAVLDSGNVLGDGFEHRELLLSSLALALKVLRADPQFYADAEVRAKTAALLHRSICSVLSTPTSDTTTPVAPDDLDEQVILGVLLGSATVAEPHRPAHLQSSNLEAALRKIVESREAYVVVVDDTALAYCGQRPPRLAALDAMLTKYETTCGGHMLVSTETLCALCQSLSSTAERCSVGWIAERVRDRRSRSVAVMPLGPSLEAIRQQRSRTDAAQTAAGVKDFTSSEESAFQLFCTLKQQIGHTKVLLITGNPSVVTASTQLEVKPVVLVGDLLTKLGAP